jgi:hypothetical protein
MRPNDHFRNLSEHRKTFIIMAIMSLIKSCHSNAFKNSMSDSTNFLLSRKSKIYPPELRFHEEYRLLTMMSYEEMILCSISKSMINYYS